MKSIPFFRQETDFYCGPAIIQMILAAHGKRRTQKNIAKKAKTTLKSGTSPTNLTKILQAEGMRVQAGNLKTLAQIKKALIKNIIVVVLYREPVWECAHYAIVKEFKDKNIILLDPSARMGKTMLLVEEFKRRWKDTRTSHTIRWAAFVDSAKSH